MFQKRIPLRTAIAIEIIVIATIAAYLLPGGEDLYTYYLPQAQGCLECGYNPWHTSWILFPIQFIPLRILWSVWVFLTLTGITWACSRLKLNPVPVLLAFPTMGLIWLGQIEVVIIIGLTLALLSPNPYVRGLGLVLASVKPHVSGIPILILLFYDKQRWKTMLLPAAVAALSFVVWGIDWPLRWFALRNPLAPLPVWGRAAFFPWGAVSFGTVFLVKKVREKITAALLASALTFPWFGVYSYTVFLVFLAPWWAALISYAWVVVYPWMGNNSLRFAWILPLSLLTTLIWPRLGELRKLLYNRFNSSAQLSDQPRD